MPDVLLAASLHAQAHGVEISGAKVYLTDIASLERFADPMPLIDQPDY
jgi:hypothetical protein